MIKKLFLPLFVTVAIVFAACNGEQKPAKHYCETTQELIDMVEADPQLKAMLEKSIARAAEINPDTVTNPVRTLEQYYDFIEYAMTAMPWSITKCPESWSIFDQIDQSLNYFYFINDIPLEELEGKGLYNNSLQYYGKYREWLIRYAKDWGEYLSTPDSWNDEMTALIMSQPQFGLQNGWYEDPSNWHSFNDFFCRNLKDSAARPVASPDDDALVISPADSEPQGKWAVDENSDIVQHDSVVIKSKAFNSVADLIGPESEYREAFAGGTLIHQFLNVHDYHRYHFPMSGKIVEMKTIAQDDAVGGVVTWHPESGRYLLSCDVPGWQMIETRTCLILETEKFGLVALLPIGMSQVSSVNYEPDLKVGDVVKKGDPLGYFLFGGSDFAIVFQKGVEVEMINPPFQHMLFGEPMARLSRK